MGRVEDMRGLGPPGAARQLGAAAPKLTKPEAKATVEKIKTGDITKAKAVISRADKVTGTPILVRLQPALLELLDHRRGTASRPEAIRQLLEKALS
jgi:hypothetical protein